MLNKYRVTWRTKSGNKKRSDVFAASSYLAATLSRDCYEDVDLILDVRLIKQF